MLDRGKMFHEKLVAARGKVGKVAAHFITDGCVSTQYIYIYQLYCYFLGKWEKRSCGPIQQNEQLEM